MNYENIYNLIIVKRQKEILVKLHKLDLDYQYCEAHHIIPRSLGGNNDKTNIVILTAKEHYICHKLLVKICESKYGIYSKLYCSMLYALNLMTFENKGNIKISSRQYSDMRRKFSEMLHIKMSGKNNPMYNHSCTEKMTKQQYIKWLKAHLGKNHLFYGKKRLDHSERMSGNKNPMYKKHIKDFMTIEEYNKWLSKVRANKNGKQNPFYGKHHSAETIEKIRNSNKKYIEEHNGHSSSYGIKRTEEQRKHNSEAHKHPYSHERKLKQTMTIIKNCYSHLCDLSEFNFELYINLSNYNKRKYRLQYIKTHQKTVQ